MPFLVIGGHAVNAYGISRQTGDIDLVVPRRSKPEWLTLMEKLRYEKGQNDERFARFRPRVLGNWPIDLMFVDDLTFEKLYGESVPAHFGECEARIVSARHLVIMKLHALKHYQEHRFAKDYTDVISLLRADKVVFDRQEFRELCVRYGGEELFEKIRKDLNWG